MEDRKQENKDLALGESLELKAEGEGRLRLHTKKEKLKYSGETR